ncbi:MAG TPA: ABC transporter permease [Phycisphaerales bacterium]|nr:ABC transporter permease [Phycisphaerales bacterium]
MKNSFGQFVFPSHLTFFLCLKYLCRKKIVVLSVAAVMMSCALLIVVASLFTGFIHAVENNAGEHLGDIIISPSWDTISNYDKLIAQLEQSEVIQAAGAVLNGHGLLFVGKGNVRAVKALGIELPSQAEVTPLGRALIRQKDDPQAGFAIDDYAETDCGFVGIGVVSSPDDVTDEYDFAKVLSENIGKKVMLTTGTGGTKKPKAIKFRVSDIVFSGYHDADNNFVYLPIETLSEALYPDTGPVADMIQIKVAKGVEPEAALATVRKIWQDFSAEYLKGVYATIVTSREMQEPLLVEYRKQKDMLMLIFGLVSGGVVLLIFCIFYLIVMTKQKDIAIVKSCGCGSGQVTGLFVMFGSLVGAMGAAFGVGLGYLVTINVNAIERWISQAFGLNLWKSSTYMFDRIPNQVDWDSVVPVVLSAVLAAGIGALIPAVTAARVKPVSILRYE